jgi:hypothetical protein
MQGQAEYLLSEREKIKKKLRKKSKNTNDYLFSKQKEIAIVKN